MTQSPSLRWLPAAEDWRTKFGSFLNNKQSSIFDAINLSKMQLDFLRTNALARAVQKKWPTIPKELPGKPIRLAILGSSTISHLASGVKIACLRRSMWAEIHEGEYGQYLQELSDTNSSVHEFNPTHILFSFDNPHLTSRIQANLSNTDKEDIFKESISHLVSIWKLAKERFNCQIIQQTIVPTNLNLIGNNEHRLHGSRRNFCLQLNAAIRDAADKNDVDIIGIDDNVSRDGLMLWHNPTLWHRSKQEITPTAAPMYGELVARILAAKQGRSYKALVLDLDNTLWGGVIGDDGLDGIVLGQGSALGEAFLSVQDYAKQQSERGVILAVCSKNDPSNAKEVFEKHPEMLLKLNDIACFIANWDDKASNIRKISETLNIGLDSLVFLDDNPFERNLVREELPMVAVPEVPDDAALVPFILAEAGYFEATTITSEDRERGKQYQANIERDLLKNSSTDLAGYLANLDMKLIFSNFDKVSAQRVTQLINKTNQFNLTTRRYSDSEVAEVISSEDSLGIHFRLIDKFGDNGIIAIIIGKVSNDGKNLVIDTWLMSCRVLGRQVEEATLDVIISKARNIGVKTITGVYIPTKKNGMVSSHYTKLGFSEVPCADADQKMYVLDIESYKSPKLFMSVQEA